MVLMLLMMSNLTIMTMMMILMMIRPGEGGTFCWLASQPAGRPAGRKKKKLCWAVFRAWTCIPSIHIQPYRYQSNPHLKIYHFKGSKLDFNLIYSRNKSEILRNIEHRNFFFCFLGVFWYQTAWTWWILDDFIGFLFFFRFFSKNGFEPARICRKL